MRKCSVVMMLAVAMAAAAAAPSRAATVAGGGSSETDCVLVLEIPGANTPALPKSPKGVDCIDGDPACDGDALRNGECIFDLHLCANSTALASCAGDSAESVTVDHSVDDGLDPRFDTDFQALQSRVSGLDLPTFQADRCTLTSSITVRLRGPDDDNRLKRNRKKLRVTTMGTTVAGAARDIDKVKLTCRPEGDAVYLPIDFYEGTFDRIGKQVFVQSCALSGCHDSESHAGELILLSGSAYGNLVGVTPDNSAAAGDMLDRVTPGDPDTSLLYLKLTGDLPAGYGTSMPYGQGPIDADLIEIIRLWIIGDGVLGPAPQTGWVAGTDQ